MIKSVYLWQNGMVVVFGSDGEQVTSLQGKASEMAPRIANASDSETCFWYGRWRGEGRRINRTEFLQIAKSL